MIVSGYTHLITPAQLQDMLAQQLPVMVFDVSFDLAQPHTADDTFAQLHVAGAQFMHLDRDLSAQPGQPAASGGRHPLPLREDFARTLQARGFAPDMQAVVYDRNGCNYAGRLWWMLKWLGHANVAVLDGGLQAWQAAGGAVQSGPAATATPAAAPYPDCKPLRQLVDTAHVQQHLGQSAQTLIDSRGGPRYRGEVEPLDPIAGHIPGALNRPFTDNIGPDGRFKPALQLQAEFEALLDGHDPRSLVVYCGSGVSAVPNILALELAGLPCPALYAGSWSEWSRTPGLPVATGPSAQAQSKQ